MTASIQQPEKENEMRKPQRQGDVLLIPVDAIPENTKPVERDSRGRLVLAEGEVTGHCHAILDDAATLFAASDLDEMADRFVRVESESVELVHDEHNTNVLEKGAWVVRPKREYAPEAPRQVID